MSISMQPSMLHSMRVSNPGGNRRVLPRPWFKPLSTDIYTDQNETSSGAFKSFFESFFKISVFCRSCSPSASLMRLRKREHLRQELLV
jgi:hypothetical protein